jgi:hypothetical protein
MTDQDHDLLIKISTDVGYIRTELKQSCKDRKKLFETTNELEDWQSTHDTKEKIVIAVASAIGGFLVFVATKIIDWFMAKRV